MGPAEAPGSAGRAASTGGQAAGSAGCAATMFAAFLRGINVGGHQVKGPELRSLFEKLGFEDVGSFRTSGNVVFRAASESPARTAARIEDELKQALGYAVPVFLRTAAEVRGIAVCEPFPRELVEASKGKLQVSMLLEEPASEAREQVLALATDEDRLAFGRRELYWLPSGGTQESELDLKRIESLLGKATMRTKGTVEQIAAKYFATEA